MYYYPAVIHKDKDSDYGVTIPDLPGCFSAGDDIEETISSAEEAITCHLEALLLDGEEIILPRPIDQYRDESDYADGFWVLVPVDVCKITGKAKRINITLPERLINQVDRFASSHGDTRSGLLAHAALEYLSTHVD